MIHFTVDNLSGQRLNTTYYPGLQMVLVGHMLFHVTYPDDPPPWRLFNVACPEWRKIWWNQIISPPSETKTEIEFRRGAYQYSYLVIRSSSQFINLWWPLEMTGGKTLLSVFLRRIQRAVKGFIRTRRLSKRLALVMALHPRLGSQSILLCLPIDVLVQIY